MTEYDITNSNSWWALLEGTWQSALEAGEINDSKYEDMCKQLKYKKNIDIDNISSSNSSSSNTTNNNNNESIDIDNTLIPANNAKYVPRKQIEDIQTKMQKWSQQLTEYCGPIFSDQLRLLKKMLNTESGTSGNKKIKT